MLREAPRIVHPFNRLQSLTAKIAAANVWVCSTYCRYFIISYLHIYVDFLFFPQVESLWLILLQLASFSFLFLM